MAQSKYRNKVASKLGLDDLEVFEPNERAYIWLNQPLAGDKHSRFPKFITYGTEDVSEYFDRGEVYVLDKSSVYAGLVLSEIEAGTVLDFCASPGGKTFLAKKLLDPELIVSNEIDKGRVKALISNLSRCSLKDVIVTSQKKLDSIFDLVIVDAPCSGQSLKQKDNPFHPVIISGNKTRQRAILNEASKNSGSYLAYITCTFSIEENEKNIDWFLKNNPEFISVSVDALKDFRSSLSENYCYRFFPPKDGRGGFCSLMKRRDPLDSEIGSLRALWRSDNSKNQP